jgi:hypothetical protein
MRDVGTRQAKKSVRQARGARGYAITGEKGEAREVAKARGIGKS